MTLWTVEMFTYPTETTVVFDFMAMCRQTSSTESVQDQNHITVNTRWVLSSYCSRNTSERTCSVLLSTDTNPLFSIQAAYSRSLSDLLILTYIQGWEVMYFK